MLCLCAAQLNFWFQTELRRENLASYYRQGRHLHLALHTMIMRFYHGLRPIFMLWLVKIWQVSSCGKIYAASWILFTLLNFDSWGWQSFLSTCDVVNCLLPLDAQNEIHLLSGVFCYSWLVLFIGLLVEKYVTCQSRKSESGWHCFRFSPCLKRKRVEKSEAILALLETFQELHLRW